jgi:hypothetical protein
MYKIAAVQEYPGCKDVREVSVAEIADIAAKTIWRVSVSDSGVSRSRKPIMLPGTFSESFGNNMIC